MFLFSGRCRGVPVHSGLQYPKSRLTSPFFCPGHEVLVLVRPVVPYTLALSSKRSRSVVSSAPCWPVASQALLLKLEVVKKKSKNIKHDYIQSMPSKLQKPSINHTLV